MAAAIHGRSGTVVSGASALGSVTGWSYEESVDEQETTAMGDTAKTYLGGLRDGSGQIDAFWYKTDTGHDSIETAFAAGTTVTLHINPEGTGTGNIDYTGDVIIKQVSVSGSKEDVITVTFQFRGFLDKTTLS